MGILELSYTIFKRASSNMPMPRGELKRSFIEDSVPQMWETHGAKRSSRGLHPDLIEDHRA